MNKPWPHDVHTLVKSIDNCTTSHTYEDAKVATMKTDVSIQMPHECGDTSYAWISNHTSHVFETVMQGKTGEMVVRNFTVHKDDTFTMIIAAAKLFTDTYEAAWVAITSRAKFFPLNRTIHHACCDDTCWIGNCKSNIHYHCSGCNETVARKLTPTEISDIGTALESAAYGWMHQPSLGATARPPITGILEKSFMSDAVQGALNKPGTGIVQYVQTSTTPLFHSATVDDSIINFRNLDHFWGETFTYWTKAERDYTSWLVRYWRTGPNAWTWASTSNLTMTMSRMHYSKVFWRRSDAKQNHFVTCAIDYHFPYGDDIKVATNTTYTLTGSAYHMTKVLPTSTTIVNDVRERIALIVEYVCDKSMFNLEKSM